MDDIDACCKAHDFCYEEVAKKAFCIPHIVIYKWEKTEDGSVKCNDCSGPSGSEQCDCRSCQCDKKLATCLRDLKERKQQR